MRRTMLLAILWAGGLAGAAHACGYGARLHTPGHHPKADHTWPISVTLTRGDLDTRVRYDFLFHGRKVATRWPFYDHHYHFKRRVFVDRTVTFPRRAIGIPLTFRVVLTNRCGTKQLDYGVTVVR